MTFTNEEIAKTLDERTMLEQGLASFGVPNGFVSKDGIGGMLQDGDALSKLIALQCCKLGYNAHVPVDSQDFPPDDAMCYITFGFIDDMLSIFFQENSPSLRHKEFHFPLSKGRELLSSLLLNPPTSTLGVETLVQRLTKPLSAKLQLPTTTCGGNDIDGDARSEHGDEA